jgi:LAO/AO transport system kinase
MRAEGRTVGVIAVDPTSPFTGGALLGDRVRMQSHALDEGVFIRSMATRGHLGGLSLAAPEAMRVLEAAGFDVVTVETVGVGQSEVEVARQSDTTIVVLAPGMGDAIQAAKAGILEIADVFCVNKSDKEGAQDTARDLQSMLGMGAGRDPGWQPPVVSTTASTGAGVEELWDAVRSHQSYLGEQGKLDERRRQRLAGEIREIVGERLKALLERAAGPHVFEELVQGVLDRRLDPYAAADELMERLGLNG